MSLFTNQDYLRSDQYRNASKLDARIALHRRFSTNPYGWPYWVFEQLALPAQCHVLDLGCGPADLWRTNRERIPGGWEITLADLTPGMIQQAQANLGHLPRRFGYLVADAQAIPFEDETLNGVIANHMLYHVPDRTRAFSEIRRVLRPGGRLYAATNGRRHMQEIRELIQRLDPKANMTTAADEFGLENGADQLAPFFADVTLHRYPDSLIVTEVEPLAAYCLSTDRSALLKENPQPLMRLIDQRMAQDGAIHITKDGGLFEAEK